MSTKTRWVSDNNPKHYFVKNLTTNNWDERDDDKWTYSYRFVSYEGRNVILFSDKLKRFIEIGDNEVKIASAPIESLDDIENIIFSFAGKWKTLTKKPKETTESLFKNTKMLYIPKSHFNIFSHMWHTFYYALET